MQEHEQIEKPELEFRELRPVNEILRKSFVYLAQAAFHRHLK
ncbi:hypothetical protein [Burkholderia territorii]|nr:hypothetical protein [Burkholderia territorii]